MNYIPTEEERFKSIMKIMGEIDKGYMIRIIHLMEQ